MTPPDFIRFEANSNQFSKAVSCSAKKGAETLHLCGCLSGLMCVAVANAELFGLVAGPLVDSFDRLSLLLVPLVLV